MSADRSAAIASRGKGSLDRQAFARLAEPLRREIKLHCYRMLGSLYEAEDLVQETFLRAWRGRDTLEDGAAFRGWLYRIATNACLDALAKRKVAARVLRDPHAKPARGLPSGEPATEIAWLEPYPDSELEGVVDQAPGPHARYESREAVKLAFIAVIQQLPPRQRAVLLLCDVLGWSAEETASLLGGSVASVNSVLQRARTTLAKRYPRGRPRARLIADARQSALLARYVKAWESYDVDGFVSLLREDAVYTMPPFREWYAGRAAIGGFLGYAWRRYGGLRLVPVGANEQPAFAVYARSKRGSVWRPHSIQLLEFRRGRIATITLFVKPGPRLFARFGLPAKLPRGRRTFSISSI